MVWVVRLLSVFRSRSCAACPTSPGRSCRPRPRSRNFLPQRDRLAHGFDRPEAHGPVRRWPVLVSRCVPTASRRRLWHRSGRKATFIFLVSLGSGNDRTRQGVRNLSGHGPNRSSSRLRGPGSRLLRAELTPGHTHPVLADGRHRAGSFQPESIAAVLLRTHQLGSL